MISCLFSDYCLTVEGAKQVEKHRQFFIQVLDYVYSTRGNKRPSLLQLLNIMKLLQKQTKVNGVLFNPGDVVNTNFCIQL